MQQEIVTVIPTRGLVFAEAIGSILENLAGFVDRYPIFGIGNIPYNFDNLVTEALHRDSRYIWLVEEDVVVPQGGLRNMIKQLEGERLDAVSAHCPFDFGGKCHHYYDNEGKFWYGGTGCVLMRVEAFKNID